MAQLKDTFITMTQQDFMWPSPKPLMTKPAQPPMDTGARLYLPRADPDECVCDEHGYKQQKDRYATLVKQEECLREELAKVNYDMLQVVSSIMDSNCEPDEDKMRNVYNTQYGREGKSTTSYRALMAAVDSPVGLTVKPEIFEIKEGYRDPNMFRYQAIERPTINAAKKLNTYTVPKEFILWAEPFTGRTEYMDTISKMGLSNMKNRQQYLEPLPSSRRRFGDRKL